MSKRLSAATLFVVLLLVVVSCASTGNKPMVFADPYNNIPTDIPIQFPDRYERFITGKEHKEFKKLLTDDERQVFIDKFWAERDTDPVTPENEYKEEIDRRIENISSERFLSMPGVFGISFRSNGGFRGDMAKVYLLHGEPDAMDTIEGNSFVPMMLWVYFNHENGRILYAFLFYRKGNSGSYMLFSQDAYQMDPCGVVYQIATTRMYNYTGGDMQNCLSEFNQVYGEIYNSSGKGGTLDGNVFAWALFNFSQGGSGLLGTALSPPKSASEFAKQSKARITGEASQLVGTAGTDYVISSCKECNSFIPAELQLGKEFTLSVCRRDIDWRVVGDQAEVELKIRIVLESERSQMSTLVFEKKVSFIDRKDLIISDPAGQIIVILLTTDEVAQIPAGTYRASIYVKNVTTGLITNKYNTWEKQFTK